MYQRASPRVPGRWAPDPHDAAPRDVLVARPAHDEAASPDDRRYGPRTPCAAQRPQALPRRGASGADRATVPHREHRPSRLAALSPGVLGTSAAVRPGAIPGATYVVATHDGPRLHARAGQPGLQRVHRGD